MRITLHKLAILTGLFLSSSVLATDINVDFTATVKASTCNITLSGDNVTPDGSDTYTLTFPELLVWTKLQIKRLKHRRILIWLPAVVPQASAKSIPKLSGNASGTTPALIVPLSSDTTSTTNYIGMGIKALGEDDSTFLIPNSAPSFIPWEISDTDKTLELTVALRETTAGSGVPRRFPRPCNFQLHL